MNRISRAATVLCLALALFPAAAAASTEVDHSALDRLLVAHVQGGLVDYAGLGQETASLDAYLESLARADLAGASREELLAFYINAYNACTLRMILRHYPGIRSIRDIEDDYGYHQWKTREWVLAGQTLSLDDMEHEILRKQLEEPRIHFAIVCASKGCPPLWEHAYSAENIAAELDMAAGRFLASPQGMAVDRGGNELRVSRIFDWFKEDFTRHGTLLEFIGLYVDDATRAWIFSGDLPDVEYLDYDWSLNDLDRQ